MLLRLIVSAARPPSSNRQLDMLYELVFDFPAPKSGNSTVNELLNVFALGV